MHGKAYFVHVLQHYRAFSNVRQIHYLLRDRQQRHLHPHTLTDEGLKEGVSQGERIS